MEIAPPKGLQLTTREAFEQAVRAYEERYLTDAQQLERIRRDLMQGDLPAEEITDELVRSYARQEARQRFIHAYTKQYLELYFPVTASMDTLGDVCDNGGFEEDFKYYEGYVSEFWRGSRSCTPVLINGKPSVFTQTSLPLKNRFEIVHQGNDILVGIPMVKFGQKALRLNNKYGHVYMCNGDYGVDRIVKRFVVTEENREFTVWYALVLENPFYHGDQQPFFSIRCDLAPTYDLCFDADILNCDGYYIDTSNCVYDSIDVLNWTCHRIKIPEFRIGDTATLEITVSDCGAGAHFGYAYIDGICEPCDSTSVLGNVVVEGIDLYCDIDYPRVCGSYSLPTLCNQNWILKSIEVPGYVITDLEIDEIAKTFCFNLPPENFNGKECINIEVVSTFTDGQTELPPVYSNTFEVCVTSTDPIYATYDIEISQCEHNNPTDKNLSDDYYYVTVSLSAQVAGISWSITRELDDPYPNESGVHKLAEGVTNATVELGPFLIQEGGWDMVIEIGPCRYREHITPPPYCSGCEQLQGTVYGNVQCIEAGAGITDKWTFDIFVPGNSGFYTVKLKKGAQTITWGALIGTKKTIGPLDVTEECLEFTLQKDLACKAKFTVCPPKPCSNTCDIEARIEDLFCNELGNGQFFVKLDANSNQGALCYKVWLREPNNSRTLIDAGPYPSNQTFGPYDQGGLLDFSIFLCNTPSCFKMLNVSYPVKCIANEPYRESEEFHATTERLVVFPNPITYGPIFLKSPYAHTEVEIFNLHGNIEYNTTLKDNINQLYIDLTPGVYILRYRYPGESYRIIKLIRL